MSAPSTNPLLELHQQTEAEFQAYAGTEIVSTFGLPQIEYAALHKSCGKMDMAQRGVLEISGRDRLDFLNRFLTNELIRKETSAPISAGQGVYAFLLNNKGRIVTDMNVLELGERTLLETDARNVQSLKSTLEKFIFSEKVQFKSLIGQLHEIALIGPKSAEALRRLAPQITDLAQLNSVSVELGTVPTIIFRDDPCGTSGFFLLVASESAAKLWTELEFTKSVGWAAFNSRRIEAGRPFFGIDFDDTVLPAETGQLERAVSFTKGCYLGQEIVARMHARGQIARQIVGIRMAGEFLPFAGAPIYDSPQSQIGIVTSSTMSPILSNAAIGLAMVKKPFAGVGTNLLVAAEGDLRPATVVDLPFVKPESGPP
jgi:folate-binding protein YgfZ